MEHSNAETIPSFALKRIREGMGKSADAKAVFTSDLSVNEFLLIRKSGFEPVGLCVGSCVYHVGIQYGNWNKNQELNVLSQAMYHARELAMSRMREEARDMNADGIVGVQLTIKRLEWDANILEFIAFGTGIVHAKGHQGFRAHDGGPFTSDLSGQEFWTLLHSGYRPIEMVMGMYEAREIAIERLQSEAAQAGAEGVVGVDMHEGSHNWQSHVIEFFAIGTAVSPLGDGMAPEKVADPMMVLAVND